MIRWYESQTNLIHYLYCYEHGQRISVQSAPPLTPAWFKVVETRQPLILNTLAELNEMSGIVVPGTDTSLAMVMVPIIGSDQVIGTISIENYDKEYAFSDANVRLLQTVASSMGVALENARLFEETQQRNAELAVINSVQEGLASKLDMQSIYDQVGEKIREIFDPQVVWIASINRIADLLQFHYEFEWGWYPTLDQSKSQKNSSHISMRLIDHWSLIRMQFNADWNMILLLFPVPNRQNPLSLYP